MKRFFVCRAYLKWKGKMYYKGDLLPAEFSHHDKARSIYNSRIGECEVEDEYEEEPNKDQSAVSTPITIPLTGNGVLESIPKIEIPVVQDEIPEVSKVEEVLEVPNPPTEDKIDEIAEKGVAPAVFNLLSNFSTGTQK